MAEVATRDRSSTLQSNKSNAKAPEGRTERSGTLLSQGSVGLYNLVGGNVFEEEEVVDEREDDDDHVIHNHHKHAMKREVLESFDFNDQESLAWRKVIYPIHRFHAIIVSISDEFIHIASI